MTLTVEEANSKLVDVVAFADVDIEESVKGGLVTAYSLQYFFCQNLLVSGLDIYFVKNTQSSGPLCLWQCFHN